MKTIPFDIKYRPQIESGEYSVQTKDGAPVRIICWDRADTYGEIVALVQFPFDDGKETISIYSGNGCYYIHESSEMDLVLADNRISPFEELLYGLLEKPYHPEDGAEFESWVHEKADELLAIAESIEKAEFIEKASKWVEDKFGSYPSEIFKQYMEEQS